MLPRGVNLGVHHSSLTSLNLLFVIGLVFNCFYRGMPHSQLGNPIDEPKHDVLANALSVYMIYVQVT